MLQADLQKPPTSAPLRTAQTGTVAALEVLLFAGFSFQNQHPAWTAHPRTGAASRRGQRPPRSARTLTFMVGGAVSGGDSGRSGRVTSELFSSSCFLQNRMRAGQLSLHPKVWEESEQRRQEIRKRRGHFC